MEGGREGGRESPGENEGGSKKGKERGKEGTREGETQWKEGESQVCECMYKVWRGEIVHRELTSLHLSIFNLVFSLLS